MSKKSPYFVIFTVGCFITGNMIGAGILGLPIKTGMAGFWPSMAGLLALSAALFFTAVVLAKESIKRRQEIFHYPSLYHEYFGSAGKWIATLANLMILYGLLTVYLTGSATVITRLLNIPVPKFVILIAFFTIFTCITFLKPKLVFRLSTLFVVLLWISFIILVVMGERYVDPSRLAYQNWKMLPAALPIIIMAANFHSIIPTVCKRLKWNLKHIVTAFLFGALIGFVMNVIWIQVGIGVMPLKGAGGILHALQKSLPATVPLAKAIKSPLFLEASLMFTLTAIITSYISIGHTQIDFIEDIITNHTRIPPSRALSFTLSFAPPLIISIIYPDIFLGALDFVGGTGKVILFGIFPCVLAIKSTRTLVRRLLVAVPALVLFCFVLIFKVGQELGMSILKRGMNYWTHNFISHNYGPQNEPRQ